MIRAVPAVATSVKPISTSRLASVITSRLSRFFTETKTLPEVGSAESAAICDLRYALRKSRSMPITSPVDFISGPSTMSTPGNLTNGNTDSLTAMCASSRSSTHACGAIGWPSIAAVATLASGRPMAFETKGTVREARGFTSST